MDKAALKRKLREIHKALCLKVDEKHFKALDKDITDWISWNRLHAASEAESCDPTYILLIEQCCKVATKNFLGDIC